MHNFLYFQAIRVDIINRKRNINGEEEFQEAFYSSKEFLSVNALEIREGNVCWHLEDARNV